FLQFFENQLRMMLGTYILMPPAARLHGNAGIGRHNGVQIIQQLIQRWRSGFDASTLRHVLSHHRMNIPPLISIGSPVTYADSSETRYSTAPATSLGVPSRRSGMPCTVACLAASGVHVALNAVPPMNPGEIAL